MRKIIYVACKRDRDGLIKKLVEDKKRQLYGRVSRNATGPGEADALSRNPHGKLTDSNNKKIKIL